MLPKNQFCLKKKNYCEEKAEPVLPHEKCLKNVNFVKLDMLDWVEKQNKTRADQQKHHGFSHLSWKLLPPIFSVRVTLGAGVEGKGGGDSDPLFGGSPLAGNGDFWSPLASYSKVRLGLGKGLTGVPTAVCELGGSGLSDLAEFMLNLCLTLEGLSDTEPGSASVVTEQTLLRLLAHVLSKSSPIMKDFCFDLSGA